MSKFKVGDTVRITREVVVTDRPFVGKVAKIIGSKEQAWKLEGIAQHMFESQLELVKPKSFTKADMQIGQIYKTKNGRICTWSMEDTGYYDKNLKWCGSGSQEDIIEVYPLNITPIWKREEPKYRVKTELTKEQAEKLGMELCEEVE